MGEVEGRVVDIRWRYTAVGTRNGETLIVPNGVLTNEKVMVLGRRQSAPLQQRRWVHFNVDPAPVAAEVVRVVTEALVNVTIPGVAEQPAPDCLFRESSRASRTHAVRYWLTDFERDVPTDSVVLTRVYFALQRAGIALAVPRARGADDRAVEPAGGRAGEGRSRTAAARAGSRSRSCGRWTRRTVTSWPTGCCTRPSRAASC